MDKKAIASKLIELAEELIKDAQSGSGFDWKSQKRWIDAGWDDSHAALEWWRVGWNPVEGLRWFEAGWTDPVEAYKWYKAGWNDPVQALEYYKQGETPRSKRII